MIGWLKGEVINKQQPGKLVMNVNGVGYDVETSLPTFFQVENQSGSIQLHIHTIVREDALLLYGFLNKEERALFRALIKVNGVGPKMAMAILSSIQPDEFIQCIQEKNQSVLTRLPGIGKKTAERLIVEMKDNLQQWPLNEREIKDIPLGSPLPREEAIKALEALGYKTQDAIKVIKKIDDGQKSCEVLIREALQLM